MTNTIKISDINLSDFEFYIEKHSTKSMKGTIIIFKSESLKPCLPTSNPVTTESMIMSFRTKHTPKKFTYGQMFTFADIDASLKKAITKTILNQLNLKSKNTTSQCEITSRAIRQLTSYNNDHDDVFHKPEGIIDELDFYVSELKNQILLMRETTDQNTRMQTIINTSSESEKTLEHLNNTISILDQTSENLKTIAFELMRLKDIALHEFLSESEKNL